MKRNKYEVSTINTMIYVMFGVMTMVCLYMTFVLPKVSVLFYILSAFFVMGILIEDRPLAAIIMYIMVSGASLLLLPIPYALPYIMFFGHYGIAKHFCERIKDKIVGYIAKLTYFNAFCALIYFLILATGFLPSDITEALPIWALVLIVQPCFVLFDLSLSFAQRFYDNNIRKKLLQ